MSNVIEYNITCIPFQIKYNQIQNVWTFLIHLTKCLQCYQGLSGLTISLLIVNIISYLKWPSIQVACKNIKISHKINKSQ